MEPSGVPAFADTGRTLRPQAAIDRPDSALPRIRSVDGLIDCLQ